MKQEDNTPKTREQLFAEKADKSYTICYSHACPLRQHCLRWQLRDYTPKDRRIANCVNLNNPAMQTDTCPMYRSDQPIRMPLGLSNMYYDMPGHLERSLKHHLIDHFNRRVYYDYHSARQPLPPEHEQYIRPAALSFGWHEPLKFNGYVEKYLW